jgi:uncharacterized membrane protein
MVLVAQIVGLLLLVIGVGLISVPASLIVAGLALLAFGVAWERATSFAQGGE